MNKYLPALFIAHCSLLIEAKRLMLIVGPIILLLSGALLSALLGDRMRPAALGLAATLFCALSLAALLAATQLGATAAVAWLTSGGRTLEIRIGDSNGLILGCLLLVCGMAVAG